MRKIAIIGAGGLAREVRWLLEEINSDHSRYEFVGYLVSDLAKISPRTDNTEALLGDLDWLEGNRGAVDELAIGIGNPKVRDELGTSLVKRFPDLSWPTLIHPSVKYDQSSCALSSGVILCAGVVATVGIKILPFALVNLACTLGHEAEIGRGSVLNPTVNVSGGAKLGNRVLVGTGAQILQYLSVGDESTIGGGAVVTRDVKAGTTVVGVPARQLN